MYFIKKKKYFYKIMKRNKLFYYYKRKNKRKILKTKIIADENDLKMKGFLYLFIKL